MKHYTFDIPDYLESEFFRAVRGKGDVLRILMNAIKHMSLNYECLSMQKTKGLKLHLVISKMNRLFFESSEKYYSISFPFSTKISEGAFYFANKHIDIVDSKLTSDIITLLNDDAFVNGNSMYDYIDGLNKEDVPNSSFWDFVLQMFLSECGYVRYDYDELRQDPKMHPLNHLDIFYSQSAAWKVGLKEKISLSDFVGSINSNTECQYIE